MSGADAAGVAAAPALATLGPGFSDQALGSQAVFRALLDALAHPGRILALAHDAQPPAGGQRAAAAALLALLDGDCTLWLSPRLAASGSGAWLRFHTGCTLVADAAAARFVWVAQGDAMPALHELAQGSDSHPEQSATCLLEVAQAECGAAALAAPGAWRLSGPGIAGHAALRVPGLAPDFLPQWQANHAAFPRGVDVLLATAGQIVGLPRSTRIEPADCAASSQAAAQNQQMAPSEHGNRSREKV